MSERVLHQRPAAPARLLRGKYSGTGICTCLLAAILLLLPLIGGSYWLFTLALCFTNAIAILSVGVLVRYAGEVSIGQGVFVAVGAYTVALCERFFGMSLLSSLPCAVVLGGVLGMVFAYPSRHLSGIYLAVVTMALALALPEVLLHFPSLTGGFEGLYVKRDVTSWLSRPTQRYYLPLIMLFAVVAMLKRFRRSFQAMALLLTKSSPPAAESFGIRRSWARLSCMALSGSLAALAGSLQAFTAATVSPNSFTLWTSIYLLVGAVVSLYSLSLTGALFGALFLTVVPMLMASLGDWVPVLYGAALLAAVLIVNVWPASFRRGGAK